MLAEVLDSLLLDSLLTAFSDRFAEFTTIDDVCSFFANLFTGNCPNNLNWRALLFEESATRRLIRLCVFLAEKSMRCGSGKIIKNTVVRRI